ncbi:MAG: ammonia channel protein [Candidatus Lambdaproteobacteria bacterium RIFOXYD2_FULL_50_16]|uniref:Ammonium transporter n=1 Tax=Candidatus Lambdaproteobacteria bacterium RIFOXYD2_FULL_50_16 TaxID=1817772 RepID=A0A1F6GF08_9PROT|nr:MAG: ammonia channel protein [Candidatus Lambdaproteobacteria bacterium RIFOXYD2_FULL_50_16]
MKRGLTFLSLLVALPWAAYAGPADSGDTAWILTSTALVLFMTLPGLALFYGGLVGSKNVLSVLMQCFAITSLVSLLWLAGLYSVAFAEGNGFMGGFSKAMFAGMGTQSLTGTIPEAAFALFQLTFAVITPALIVGAFAERMKFSAMLIFSGLWVAVVYAPVTHWVWGGGWLGEMGLLDFAGGTVVHITAGVAALVAALVVGPRRTFPRTSTPPHNMTMTVTGAGMLWVGWFGFNGGSALGANGSSAMAMLVTHISAAAGSLAWMALEWRKFGKPSVLGIVTGMVAGLGTITPACGFVGPGGALLIGLIAGVVCFNATNLIKVRLKIDDSLDVFPVHGVGGIIGTLMAGFFASTELGVFSGFGFGKGIESLGQQLMVQATGVLATGVYAGVVSFGLFKLTDALVGLRVDEEQEVMGLDLTQHEERGYIL